MSRSMLRFSAPLLGLAFLAVGVPPASSFDARETFKKGAYVLSAEGGFIEQDNLEAQSRQTGLEGWNVGVRGSRLPLGPTLSGPFYGALEVGLEPFYQRYTEPFHAFFAGLGVAVRYHFLALGRVVPYVEAMGAAGGTDLETHEIRSTFTFLVHGGAGLSVFITDRAALYAGYRLQHVSNGNIESPNRGFESHGPAFGVSVFSP